MWHPPGTSSSARLWSLILGCLVTLPVVPACQETPTEGGPVISGHVIDPHNLEPEDAVLMLGSRNVVGNGESYVPVRVRSDGSFVTPRLDPATYVLKVVRTPHSPTKAATPVGFSIVPVETSDVSGVTITVRPDTAITGEFRMESDSAVPHPRERLAGVGWRAAAGSDHSRGRPHTGH
jgi:hypothetical protein